MLNSLGLRLILMFMLVVMVAVGTVALVASQATSSDLQVYSQTRDDQQIILPLLTAYNHHQSQKELQALTEQLARSWHRHIILLDHQNRVFTDSDRKQIGQVIALQPSTGVLQASTGTLQVSPGQGPISISGVFPNPSTLYISTNVPHTGQGSSAISLRAGSPETNFITSVNRSLWLAVLIAGLTALLLALVFAHTILKPIRALKAAASRMEQGDLNQRASIKTRGELIALAHAFNTMADSLSRSEQLRRNLVSDVAHELRNPLMNIRGYLELLQDQVLEPTRETLASLYEETTLLSRLVADLQDLSLAEAGRLS